MAITRAQQAKQMLRDGGRTGFRIGSDEGNVSGREYGGSSGAVDTGDLGSLEANVAANQAARDYSDSSPVDTGDLGTQAANVAALRDANRFRGDNRLENAIKLLSPFSKERQKALYNLSMGIPGQKKRSAKYQKAYKDYLKSLGITEEELEGELPSANFFVDKGFIDKPKPEDAMLPEPMSYGDFLLKEFNNPTVKYRGDIGRYREEMGLDNDDPPLLFPRSGIMAQAPEEKKEEDDDPVNLRLLAEGGRAGFQEGGGIEQRLEQLGGDVTSAEQMLQGINQRLKTAESSLGSGGGLGGLPGLPTGLTVTDNKTPTNTSMPENVFMGNAIMSSSIQQLPSIPPQQNPNIFGYNPSASGSANVVKDAYATAQQAAEKAREEGFAGRMVLPGEMSFEDFSNLYNQGRFDPIKSAAGNLGFANLGSIGKPVELIPMRGGAQMLRGNFDQIQRGRSGIPALGFADGGDVEPVAKKTMPLLDLKGQEMDLRDNGGFVPIGRMEKADDVPARLSKNEFVFTADAVRNAGDGDIDKGAEVMYNMMKNLEDGGNVSEESQGLEGARKMFQTAQRLEEVL